MQVALLMSRATFHRLELLGLICLLDCELLLVHILKQVGLHERLFAQ